MLGDTPAYFRQAVIVAALTAGNDVTAVVQNSEEAESLRAVALLVTAPALDAARFVLWWARMLKPWPPSEVRFRRRARLPPCALPLMRMPNTPNGTNCQHSSGQTMEPPPICRRSSSDALYDPG